MPDLILLGYISKAFGTKGGVHVKLLNPESEALSINSKIIIKLNNTQKNLIISQAVPNNRYYFADINTRDDAEKLQGAEIYMNRADFPKLLDDEFYLTDLLGFKILLVNQEYIGTLIGFSSNNAQVLLEIETSSGHIASVPWVSSIVKNIDQDQKIIILDPPEGLLEPLD